jgi:hypothetical protein
MATDWRTELSDLLAAYLGHQSLQEGVDEMVHVTAKHPDYHKTYLSAIDAGITAAQRQESGLLDLMSKTFVVVSTFPEAMEFLQRLKATYIDRYRAAIQQD